MASSAQKSPVTLLPPAVPHPAAPPLTTAELVDTDPPSRPRSHAAPSRLLVMARAGLGRIRSRLATVFPPRFRPAGSGPHSATVAALRPEPVPVSLFGDAFVTAMTIVIVDEAAVRRNVTAVVARVATLAVNDEVLVVCPSTGRPPGPHGHVVAAGLRRHLPRHNVVALDVSPDPGTFGHDAATVGEFLEIGSLPVVVTPARAVRNVGAALSHCLGADRVLTVTCTGVGAELRQLDGDRSPCLAS